MTNSCNATMAETDWADTPPAGRPAGHGARRAFQALFVSGSVAIGALIAGAGGELIANGVWHG